MDIKESLKLANLIDNFNKYAKFISQHFEVEVQFDSNKCETDKKVIKIPALETLSEKEINVLYALLLHEAGHIKYSDFSPEAFAKIPTENFALLANALEDARIENNLIKDFGGGQEVLSRLYNDCVKDLELKNKFYPQKFDLLSMMALYLHHKFYQGNTAGIEEVIGKNNFKKLNDFINQNKIDNYLNKEKLTSWDDVVRISNKIHNLIYKNKVDTSPKIKIPQQAQVLENTKKELNKIPQKVKQINEKIEELKKQIKEKKEQLKQKFSSQLNEKNQLLETIKEKSKQLDMLEQALEYVTETGEAKEKFDYWKGKREKAEKEIENIKNKIENFEKKLNPEKLSNIDEQTQKKLDEQYENLQQLYDEYQKQMEELENAVNQQKIIEKSEEQINRLNELLKNNQEKQDKQNEIKQKLEDKLAKATSSEEKNKLKEQIKEKQELLDQLKEKQENYQKKLEQHQENKQQAQEQLDKNNLENLLDKINEQLQKISEQSKQQNPELANQCEKTQKDINNIDNQQLLDNLNQAGESIQKEVQKAQDASSQSGKKLTPDEKKKIEEKLKAQEEKLKNMEDALKTREQKENKNMEEFNKGQNSIEQIKQANNLQSLNKEQLENSLKESIKNLEKEIEPAQSKLSNIESKMHEDKMQIAGMQSKQDSLKQQIQQEVMDNLIKMHEQLQKAGIDSDLLPKFEKMEGWDEANQAQQDFDKQTSQETGQFVSNGEGLESAKSDIMLYLDEKREGLEQIDITKAFKNSAKFSKMDALNNAGNEETAKDDDETRAYHSIKKHTVASKQFDEINNENSVKDLKDFNQLRVKLAGDIQKVKNIMRLKFKYSKKDFFKGGKEEGELDARNLYKLATGLDSNFYEENNPKFINKITASILVDVSGSMDKDYTEHGQKLKELSLLLSEGLREVHIPHEILGYCAPVCQDLREKEYGATYNRKSNKLETIVYKKFEDKHNYGINNIEIKAADNADGESLAIAKDRLKKKNSKSKLLFIITDGKPFLCDADIAILDEDFRKSIRECVKDKIEIFALGFNDSPKEFFGERYLKINKYDDLINYIKKMDLTNKNNPITPVSKLRV